MKLKRLWYWLRLFLAGRPPLKYDRCIVCGKNLYDRGGAPDYCNWHYACEDEVFLSTKDRR